MVATAQGESAANALLLTDDGDLSPELTRVLRQVFARFVGAEKEEVQTKGKGNTHIQETASQEDGLAKNASLSFDEEELPPMTDAQLDDFARTVNNGKTMPQQEKDELREFFDVDGEGNLTFSGFCEMYHMQTSSDEGETWNDLEALGYDRQLAQRQS